MSRSNLKFLIDVGVSKKVEEWLLEKEYDMKAVRDIDPGMSDREALKAESPLGTVPGHRGDSCQLT